MTKALPRESIPQHPEDHVWDAIVIGTGAGGATAGFNLARLGRSVLFVERGKLVHQDPPLALGEPFSWTDHPENALNHGWWPRPFYQQDRWRSRSDEAADRLRRRRIDCAFQWRHGPISAARLLPASFLSGRT